MSYAEELVLENKDLRKEILKHIVYKKYKNDLYDNIKEMLDNAIIQNWYKFCSCDLCMTRLNT